MYPCLSVNICTLAFPTSSHLPSSNLTTPCSSFPINISTVSSSTTAPSFINSTFAVYIVYVPVFSSPVNSFVFSAFSIAGE